MHLDISSGVAIGVNRQASNPPSVCSFGVGGCYRIHRRFRLCPGARQANDANAHTSKAIICGQISCFCSFNVDIRGFIICPLSIINVSLHLIP